MAGLKTILVAGATGKQGGALISSLLSLTPPQYSIIALTRNAESAKAKSLASKPNITILEGDLNDSPAIFSKIRGSLHGVFSVQSEMKFKVEEQQGKDFVDAASKYGVRHFVYASVDRGGPDRSDVDGTPVVHFNSKFNVENHLKKVGTEKGIAAWTIIRPVAFMENLTPDFLGKAFATMWKQNGVNSRLQFVSAKDIGRLAALVFQNPEEFLGRSLSFAADELSWKQANEIFRKNMGTDFPLTYGVIARLLKFIFHQNLGTMYEWFAAQGYGADLGEFKARIPELMTFEEWLRTESGFKGVVK